MYQVDLPLGNFNRYINLCTFRCIAHDLCYHDIYSTTAHFKAKSDFFILGLGWGFVKVNTLVYKTLTNRYYALKSAVWKFINCIPR